MAPFALLCSEAFRSHECDVSSSYGLWLPLRSFALCVTKNNRHSRWCVGQSIRCELARIRRHRPTCQPRNEVFLVLARKETEETDEKPFVYLSFRLYN